MYKLRNSNLLNDIVIQVNCFPGDCVMYVGSISNIPDDLLNDSYVVKSIAKNSENDISVSYIIKIYKDEYVTI